MPECLWCGQPMAVDRASKKCCSASCNTAYYRWRDKNTFSNIEGFKFLPLLVKAKSHPNMEFQYPDEKE